MMSVPSNLRYTASHEWIDDTSPAAVGITAHATEQLGDLVYLSLPEVGDDVVAGEVFGEVESTKSVSELFAPASGKIAEVNDEAVDDPELVNADPYGAWLVKIEVTELGSLLTAAEYEALADQQ